jgi:uncharacterized integral membrane protein (TIGR00698 family)
MSNAAFSSRSYAGIVARAYLLLPGLLLCAGIAAAAIKLGNIAWLQDHGISALTASIVLGMLLGNTVYPRHADAAAAGVTFSKQSLLRLGVVLYGLRLTLQDVAHVGLAGVLVDALVIASTFTLAYCAGTRWFGLDRKTAMLIGVGSSICGAAAVVAAEPVVKGRAEQVTVAIATVVVFGTIGIFLYPVLFTLNEQWVVVPGGMQGFGVYAGSTIHEVAQVVAAARSIGAEAADAAVIAKMVRVMMLAPFLMLLSVWLGRNADRRTSAGADTGDTSAKVPWFAFGFIAMVLVNSTRWLPAQFVALATQLDTGLLATAMAALGLSTHVGAIRRTGAKPLLLALVLFAWLLAGGAFINHFVPALLARA